MAAGWRLQLKCYSDSASYGVSLKPELTDTLVLFQYDNAGFSAPVVFHGKAQCVGNGLSPCQALQRRRGTPQARPKGWPVSVHGYVAPLVKGYGH